jgi:hypothetical protein
MTAPKTLAEALADVLRAKPLRDRPEFRASWFGVAANDNGVVCNCAEQAASPAPDSCPVHDE